MTRALLTATPDKGNYGANTDLRRDRCTWGFQRCLDFKNTSWLHFFSVSQLGFSKVGLLAFDYYGKNNIAFSSFQLSCTPGREMAFREKGQTLARELWGWASGAVWVQGPSAQICTCAPISQRAACHGRSWTPSNTKSILLRGAEWECFWTSSQNCERWNSPPWGDEEGGTDWAQLTDVMFISEMVRERQAGGRCTRCLWSQEKWPR